MAGLSKTLRRVVKRARDAGVDLGVSQRGRDVTLSMIRTSDAGKGKASDALDDLLRAADDEGLRVALTPEPVGKGGLSKRQLEAWYRRRGFQPNKGKNKDYAISEEMIRNPKAGGFADPRMLGVLAGLGGAGTLAQNVLAGVPGYGAVDAGKTILSGMAGDVAGGLSGLTTLLAGGGSREAAEQVRAVQNAAQLPMGAAGRQFLAPLGQAIDAIGSTDAGQAATSLANQAGEEWQQSVVPSLQQRFGETAGAAIAATLRALPEAF